MAPPPAPAAPGAPVAPAVGVVELTYWQKHLIFKWTLLTLIPSLFVGIMNTALFWYIPVVDGGGFAPKLLVLLQKLAFVKYAGYGAVVLIFFIAWILDVFTFPHNKRHSPGKVTMVLWLILGFILTIALFVACVNFPFVPLFFSAFVVYPILVAAIRSVFKFNVDDSWKKLSALELKIKAIDFRFTGHVAAEALKWREDKLRFYQGIALSSGITGFLLLIMYGVLVFIIGDQQWTPETFSKMEDAGLDQDTFPYTYHVVHLTVFTAPALTGICFVIFSFLGSLRLRMQRNYAETDSFRDLLSVHMMMTEGQDPDDRTADAGDPARELMKQQETISKLSQQLHYSICVLCATCLVIYYAIKLAGSSALGSLFTTFASMFIVISGILLYMNMNKLFAGYSKKLEGIPVMKTIIGFKHSNWVHALIVLFVLPFIPFYAIASACNKVVRNIRGIEDVQDYDINVDDGMFTKRFTYHRLLIKQWNVTQVLMKLFWWGIIVFFATVGVSLALNIALAFLRETIETWPIYLVIAIWFAVGLLAFMLPPVPGPPVYLFGGVIIVNRASDFISSPVAAFVVGNIVTILLCWALKLGACTIQQKLIGQPLGNNMTIRQLCGVNKPMMRCIEMILKEPGVPLGKVAILCGGPDWPTSVMCGILKVPLKEALLGTLPIVLFIIPVVCTGSFYLHADGNEFFTPLANLMLLISMLLVIIMGIAATSEIQDRYNRYHREVTVPRQGDMELDWLSFKIDRKAAAFVEMTSWSNISLLEKSLLLIIAFSQTLASYAWLVFPGYLFKSFQITDSTSELDSSFIKVPGYGAFGLFFSSIMIYTCILKPLLNSRCSDKFRALDSEADLMRAQWEKDREETRNQIIREIELEQANDENRYMTVNEVLEDRMEKDIPDEDKAKMKKTMKNMEKLIEQHTKNKLIANEARK